MVKNKKTANTENQQKAIEDYTNILKRLQADFENYIKRVEKEREDFVAHSNHKLIARLLTVADDFEKALEAMKKENNNAVNGVEMIQRQFYKILQDEGVSSISAVGNKLDPFKHEVIDTINGEEDDIVVEEIQKGYMLKSKVLRPSRVRISKKSGGNQE